MRQERDRVVQLAHRLARSPKLLLVARSGGLREELLERGDCAPERLDGARLLVVAQRRAEIREEEALVLPVQRDDSERFLGYGLGSLVAPIDSILGIVVQQQATELRLGTDRLPRMFQRGTQKRLAIPETTEETLRHLLGGILSAERDRALGEGGRVEFAYEAGALGAFQVTIAARAAGEAGFDVVFVRSGRGAPPPPASAEPMHVEQPAPPVSLSVSTSSMSSDLASLLARASQLRASDVHLLSGALPSVRVDGRLRALPEEAPADVEQLLGDRLTPDARARIAEGRSADLAIELPGVGRFRVNVYLASEGLAAAIRLVSRLAPSLASLHLPLPLEDLAELPHGLVIVCGPTGSGKSSTLAALAQEALRRRSVLLIGLEDPIEYVLTAPTATALVRQRQIGRDVRDFATGLRDALREDPDILLIGEMRDPETIELALTAAETGHLVLTSLHSRSTASAVERIVDAYPPEGQQQIRAQLAESLRAIVAQRLLPRARGTGRVPAIEVLRGTHGVASVIREGKSAQIASAIQSARKEGMVSLERSLADLVRKGEVTLEAARAVANEPSSLDMYMRA